MLYYFALQYTYYSYSSRREKRPYSYIFWYVFSLIQTEYGEENTDQKNCEYRHEYFSRGS